LVPLGRWNGRRRYVEGISNATLPLYKPLRANARIGKLNRNGCNRGKTRFPPYPYSSIDKVVPNLTIAVERAVAKAIPVDVLATKDPSSGLILKAYRQRIVKPVVNVGIPDEGAMDFDVNIRQASGVHDTANIVCLVLFEDDFATVFTGLVAASAESIFDGVRSVVGTGVDHTGLDAAGVVMAWGAVVGKSQSRKAKREDELLVHPGRA
jgi:hypothetical protein